LVDAWSTLENYKDLNNKQNDVFEKFYEKTLQNVEPWKDKIEVCRAFTTVCAEKYKGQKFDYV
jgi:hypothetical protein